MDENPDTQTAQLNTISKDTLTPLVRSALNSETVEVIKWDCNPLGGGVNIGTVYRILGEGNDQGHVISWSLILKILNRGWGSTDISSWSYYKREVDAYKSEMLDDLPGNLTAPRCYGVTDFPDDTCWLWLEDVTDDIGSPWPIEHFGVVAQHIGEFNGTYLVEQPLPT